MYTTEIEISSTVVKVVFELAVKELIATLELNYLYSDSNHIKYLAKTKYLIDLVELGKIIAKLES